MADRDRPLSWSHKYPPLAGVLIAGLLAAFVLPNALNTPVTNPGQTLEFAPVPPEDDVPPPDAGNIETLGLGSSSSGPEGTLGGDPPPPTPPPPPLPAGSGDQPVTKRCVGTPPRQTEDPLSPPCVAHFDGDNGGATAPGVEGDEIRIVWYFNGGHNTKGQSGTSRGFEPAPAERIIDLRVAPEEDEYVWARVLRPYARYFNQRYQTYGRTVHAYAHFGHPDESPETRRTDALTSVREVDPFAVVIGAGVNDNLTDYVDEVVRRGVPVFMPSDGFGSVGLREATYRAHAGLLWSFNPSLERRADVMASYVCTKVLGHPVSFSGNAGDAGQERRLGLVRRDSPERADMARWADSLQERIEACGGRFAQVVSYTSGSAAERQEPLQNIATLQQEEVTTIVWVGSAADRHTEAAAALGYLPEWVVLGDGIAELTSQGQLANQRAWEHARAVTTFTYRPPFEQRPCVVAALEADPAVNRHDLGQFGCRLYPDARQLFIGIQVAGPRLTVESMDRGFHAIPPGPSSTPVVPACFYEDGDYTCVKDATAGWWDPDGANTNNTRGCWRLYEDGRRSLAGGWPEGDVDAQRHPDDPCSLLGFHPAPDG